MATLQLITRDVTHADATKNQRGCYKRGMIVAVYEDGVCTEAPSTNTPFIFIHVPTVPAARVLKYMAPQLDPTDVAMGIRVPTVIRRRRWRLRWEDLPAAVRTRIISQRQITVAVAAYAGPRDYEWPQVRDFLRNQETGLDETGEP